MTIEELLRDDEPAILDEASRAVARLDHYRRDGAEATRRRLEALYHRVIAAVETLDPAVLRAHAARVARERREAGFELSEVEAAVSLLEAAIRRHAAAELPADGAWEVALVATAFAHGQDALRQTYTALAAGAPGAGVDLTPLFLGAQRRFAEDLVYPV